MVKVAQVLWATLDLSLSGGINPRPNGISQERRRNGRFHRLSTISVKQIMVKSTTPPISLHRDVIGNIQHLPIGR